MRRAKAKEAWLLLSDPASRGACLNIGNHRQQLSSELHVLREYSWSLYREYERVLTLLELLIMESRDRRLLIYPKGVYGGVTTGVYGGLGYIRTLITTMYLVLRVQSDLYLDHLISYLDYNVIQSDCQTCYFDCLLLPSSLAT